MNGKESSTLPPNDPCHSKRMTYENCLRLKIFDSKCFLDHIDYKDCILLHSKPEVKKIEIPAVQGNSTQTRKDAE